MTKLRRKAESGSDLEPSQSGHAFISYVREDKRLVDRLCRDLKTLGIRVWLDRNSIFPGQRWKDAIRAAIRDGGCFIACFSEAYQRRPKTYENEELIEAIEILRQHHVDAIWFIPVRLNECDIPGRSIGGGETLRDLHCVDLFENWYSGVKRIATAIRHFQNNQVRPVQLRKPHARRRKDPGKRINELLNLLHDKLRKLQMRAASNRDAVPYALVGGTYLDIILDPISTRRLGPDEWINLKPAGVRIGGSAVCVGRFLYSDFGRKSYLFSAAGIPGKQEDMFTREYFRLLREERHHWIIHDYLDSGNHRQCAVTVLLYQSDDKFVTMFTYAGALTGFGWSQIEEPLTRTLASKRKGGTGGVLYLSGFLKTDLHQKLVEHLQVLHEESLICLDHGRLRPENLNRNAIGSIGRAFRRGLIDVYICTFDEMCGFCRELLGEEGRRISAGARKRTILKALAGWNVLPPLTFVRGEDIHKGAPLVYVIVGKEVFEVKGPSAWRPDATVGPRNAFNAAVLHYLIKETADHDLRSFLRKVATKAISSCQHRLSTEQTQ